VTSRPFSVSVVDPLSRSHPESKSWREGSRGCRITTNAIDGTRARSQPRASTGTGTQNLARALRGGCRAVSGIALEPSFSKEKTISSAAQRRSARLADGRLGLTSSCLRTYEASEPARLAVGIPPPASHPPRASRARPARHRRRTLCRREWNGTRSRRSRARCHG
jgi:hypothetical protein